MYFLGGCYDSFMYVALFNLNIPNFELLIKLFLYAIMKKKARMKELIVDGFSSIPCHHQGDRC